MNRAMAHYCHVSIGWETLSVANKNINLLYNTLYITVDLTHLTFACRLRCAGHGDENDVKYEQVQYQCNYKSNWNSQGNTSM